MNKEKIEMKKEDVFKLSMPESSKNEQLWRLAYHYNSLDDHKLPELDQQLQQKYNCLAKLKSQKIFLTPEQIVFLATQTNEDKKLAQIEELARSPYFNLVSTLPYHDDLSYLLVQIWLNQEEKVYHQPIITIFEVCIKYFEISKWLGPSSLSYFIRARSDNCLLTHEDPVGLQELVKLLLLNHLNHVANNISSLFFVYKITKPLGISYQEALPLLQGLFGDITRTPSSRDADEPCIMTIVNHIVWTATDPLIGSQLVPWLDLFLAQPGIEDYLLAMKNSTLDRRRIIELFYIMNMIQEYQQELKPELYRVLSPVLRENGITQIILSYFFSLETLQSWFCKAFSSAAYFPINQIDKDSDCNFLKVLPASLFIYQAFRQGKFIYSFLRPRVFVLMLVMKNLDEWFEKNFSHHNNLKNLLTFLEENNQYEFKSRNKAPLNTHDLLADMRKDLAGIDPIIPIAFSVNTETKAIAFESEESGLKLATHFLNLAYRLPRYNRHLDTNSVHITFLCTPLKKQYDVAHIFGIHLIISKNEFKRSYAWLILDPKPELVPLAHIRLLTDQIKEILDNPTSIHDFCRGNFNSAAQKIKAGLVTQSEAVAEECKSLLDFLDTYEALPAKIKTQLLSEKAVCDVKTEITTMLKQHLPQVALLNRLSSPSEEIFKKTDSCVPFFSQKKRKNHAAEVTVVRKKNKSEEFISGCQYFA